jgi:O-antigen biosynthesis protein
VREALDSLLQQTYNNFEVIIVDDGSTDDTPQILEEYARRDERIRVVRQQNQRLPRALNTGFNNARGEFLTWTSADNRCKPEFLAKMVDCLQRHPDWDMVYANVDIIDEKGQPLKNSDWYKGYQNPPGSEHIFLPTDPAELNVIPNNYIGSAFLYRDRVQYLLGDYDPFRFGTEDYDYWMRVNALLNLHHADFDEPVYDYRFHSTSLTSRDEELGITRSREGLMVFEEARRDFYLSPSAWLISADSDPHSNEFEKQMGSWIERAGQVCLDENGPELRYKYPFWYPLAAVRVTSNPAEAAPDPSWPVDAYKVLVVPAPIPLLDMVQAGWDMCFSVTGDEPSNLIGQSGLIWVFVPDSAALCTAIDIRVKSAQMECLSKEIASSTPPILKISVVVCTYRRGPQLIEALRSTARQSFPFIDYEVIVVNNDPDDPTVEPIIEELRRTDFSNRPERLKLLICPFKGLSYARNAGIAEARGELVCFLDDDAHAFSDWLEQVWQAYEENPEAGVIGGMILLKPPQENLKWLKPGWEGLWSHYTPPYQKTEVVNNWWEFPWGANWSGTRRALAGMGGFRGRYGRRGADFGGGEEMIAANLIQRLGYKIAVTPKARVNHLPDLSRYTFKHVRKTILASKMSEYGQQRDLYLPQLPDQKYFKNQRPQLCFWKSTKYIIRPGMKN